jgi:hypothetical protein
MLRLVALIRTDVSEKSNASIVRVTRIGKLGTTLAVTSNGLTLRHLLVTPNVVPSSHILHSHRRENLKFHIFLSPWWWRRYFSQKHRFLQEPQGVISQKTALFLVTAVNISNLAYLNMLNAGKQDTLGVNLSRLMEYYKGRSGVSDWCLTKIDSSTNGIVVTLSDFWEGLRTCFLIECDLGVACSEDDNDEHNISKDANISHIWSTKRM